MRTTIDLPDDILRKAKIAAVERGTTLRELVSKALARDLNLEVPSPNQEGYVEFPLKRTKPPRSLNLTNADIQRIEDEDEEKRLGFSD